MHCTKKSIRGSAIIEPTLAMFVIFLVLGGLLQLFYFAVGQMITDYAALRGVRSHVVGFRNDLVGRAAQVSAIGASGNIVEPEITIYKDGSGRPDYKTKIHSERSYVNTYLIGWRFLRYEFWNGNGNSGNRNDYTLSPGVGTKLSYYTSDNGNESDFTMKFKDYALLLLRRTDTAKTRIQSRNILEGSSGGRGMPDLTTSTPHGASLTNLFFGDLHLEGKARMRNHAKLFLDLGDPPQ